MVFGAILAGGKGTRMGIDKPKQFLMLGSRPIIIHTIEKFILSPDIDEIYVGVHPDWIDYTEDLIKKYIDSDKNIILVPGGTDRNSTIFNIIDEIEKRNGDDEDNIIVICVVRNVPVRLVKGEVSNMKITTIDDMKAATALIMEDIKC